MPPIIVAAIPIRSDLTAEMLVEYTEKIVRGLIAVGARLASYSCDGTEIERAIQRLMIARSDSTLIHTIEHPRGGTPLKITIPVFGGHPIAMVQDSKHGLKTFRNNLFSGARLLTFGNYTAIYRHIREMAFEPDSPLYHRDVEKLDRQDDNAATRLFSAATLDYLGKNHPENVFTILMNFVFAELCDAYQSRHITHREREVLVLRAFYFIEMWQTYLDNAGYKRAQYCISREALDIAHYLVEGLLSLVIIYRDYFPDDYPLLTWLHSTEPCEHVFGECRFVVPDFALLEFFQMVPRIEVKIRQSVHQGQCGNSTNRARGYNHTYFDNHGIDLLSFPWMRTFPRLLIRQQMKLIA